MTRRKLRFTLREMMAATALVGLVVGAFVARIRHPGRPELLDTAVFGAVAVAGVMISWRLRPILHRCRLRSLARRHAPPPRPSTFRPPDHTEFLASRSFLRPGEPRPIVRDRHDYRE